MLDWLHNNRAVFWSFIGLSTFTLLASLFITPWLVVRIPADYFSPSAKHPQLFANRHSAVRTLLVIGKNVLGVIFVFMGVLMLVLPGQGVLTILAGLVLIDFPGRRRVLERLVSLHTVHRSLNWIRARAGKEPLVVGSS
jgi:hypothetical protein